MPSTNKGVFYSIIENKTLVKAGDQSGYLLWFLPQPNAVSEGAPIATITYYVEDPHGAQSILYRVNFLVNFVAFPITYKEDTVLTTDEDVQISFRVDRYGVDYFGGNLDTNNLPITGVSLSVSNVQFNGTGTFVTCDTANNCQTITGNSPVATGSTFKFIGGLNENGPNAVTFDLTLTPNTGAPAITVKYVVNVYPVNDAPVLVPYFHTIDAEESNFCDEDTYFVVNFTATDIDSPLSSIQGQVIQFLYQGASGKYYLCDGSDPNKKYDDCFAGTKLVAGFFPATDPTKPYFSFVFIPDADQNGLVRLLISVVDDYYADSQKEIVEIRVRPINDYPWFVQVNGTTISFHDPQSDATVDAFEVLAEVADLRDYKFGKVVTISYYAIVPEGADPTAVGTWVVPANSASGLQAPCVVSNNGLNLTCTDKIEKLNSWTKNVHVVFIPGDSVDDLAVYINVNDQGAIDYLNRSLDANATLHLSRTAAELITSAADPTNNVALIAAPIAGLIAGAIIAGLIFAIRRKQAKAAVENYFDKFALGVEGMTNASPLYVEAKKGGESPLYKSTNDQPLKSSPRGKD
jgi:hypothetical protein